MRDDGDRSKIAALLSTWGDRIQQSVFECTLTPDDLDELHTRVVPLIDVDTDSIHFVPICASCDRDRRLIGQALRPDPTVCWIV